MAPRSVKIVFPLPIFKQETLAAFTLWLEQNHLPYKLVESKHETLVGTIEIKVPKGEAQEHVEKTYLHIFGLYLKEEATIMDGAHAQQAQ